MINYILILIALLVLLYIARKPRTAPDRQGSKFNDSNETPYPQEDQAQKELTVASYNVQTGKSLEGVRDISRAAAVLAEVDLVGVQEVYAPSWTNKFGFGLSQTEALAKKTNFAWLFCPTRFRWFRENRGNAILSKLPITSWQTTMLSDQSGFSFRNMTVAQFLWQDQDCYFINTHLHTRAGKLEQLQEVLKEFDKYQNAILVGDFNSTPDTLLLKNYLASNDATDAIFQSNIDDQDPQRIDWIITKGWEIKSGRKIDKGISDHPYYEISLELI